MSQVSGYCELLAPVIDVAQAAALEILRIYEGGFSVNRKADETPVTEADVAASELIVAALTRLTPDWPVLSEEGCEPPFAERRLWSRYWLVDPLDGTREFIRRNGEFTVNIALIEEGEPVLGVILAPVSGDLYFAARGEGAFTRDRHGASRRITTRGWDGGKLVVAGSRSHRQPAFRQFLSQFPDHQVLSLGSSLKSCYVAQGRADVYVRFGPTSEWDTAAAQCIVEEAGGQLTDMSLQPLRYNTKASLLNPPFLVFGDGRWAWDRYVATAL